MRRARTCLAATAISALVLAGCGATGPEAAEEAAEGAVAANAEDDAATSDDQARAEEKAKQEAEAEAEAEEQAKREAEEKKAAQEEARKKAEAEEKKDEARQKAAAKAKKKAEAEAKKKAEEAKETATVSRVVDGATVELSNGEAVRVVGIDTPERGECGFTVATEHMEALVLGKQVTLTASAQDDRDRYGRILRYADVGSADASLAQIEKGYANARYDSRDGYGAHPREKRYVNADERVADDFTCTDTGSSNSGSNSSGSSGSSGLAAVLTLVVAPALVAVPALVVPARVAVPALVALGRAARMTAAARSTTRTAPPPRRPARPQSVEVTPGTPLTWTATTTALAARAEELNPWV